ncbi:tetratricopeptide repeat protein [Bacillus sp. 31A1R]|uniref:Tetratricopeptide repeat protein n=1 Tax=Robertmurraya mangrovi TaxID=3098077 RepID=A0ABU5IY06_9BACI|nr:tetratricopeptide repeat protein [Bacillus sp. 31A1R]MDZ5472011.1 tetratricopeptide repeat protein [Bacillus sp. 31A1R]
MIDSAVKLMEENNYKEAKELLLDLIVENSEDYLINFYCAEAHDGLGLEREAIPFYQKALENGMEGELKEKAFVQLGSSLRCIGEYDHALVIFKEGLKEFPNNHALKVFLSMTLYNIGEYKESVENLLETIIESSSDKWINTYKRALSFYAKNIDEKW